jgi:hypothetical protein
MIEKGRNPFGKVMQFCRLKGVHLGNLKWQPILQLFHQITKSGCTENIHAHLQKQLAWRQNQQQKTSSPPLQTSLE